MKKNINRTRRNNHKISTFLSEIPDVNDQNSQQFIHFNEELDGIGRIVIFTTGEI